MDTCNNVIQPLIAHIEPKLVRHNSWYNRVSTTLPQLYATVCVKSHSSGRKHKWTCTPFLSTNKKGPIIAKMKPRALRSKVTTSASGSNWSHDHHIEIVDPLRASAGGMTLSSSQHNSVTSNMHVPVIVGLWIWIPRMIETSYNVTVISPRGT